MLATEAALPTALNIVLDTVLHAPAKQIVVPLTPETAHVNGSFAGAAKNRMLVYDSHGNFSLRKY